MDDYDHDQNDGIEMNGTAIGGFVGGGDNFDDEEADSGVPNPEPLSTIKPLVRSQNRMFLCAIATVMIAAAVYVIGGVYQADDNDLPEDYNVQKGVIEDGNEFPTLEGDYPAGGKKGHASANWFDHNSQDNNSTNGLLHQELNRTQNAHDAAMARWNRTHPGEPLPGKCERIESKYRLWHNENITLADGVQYTVIEQMQHDGDAFTQGLTYHNGKLYESTGLNGKSSVRILDAQTAKVEKKIDMAYKYFGEGMAFVNGLLYQITWKKRTGFVYNATDLSLVKQFSYTTTKGEGWGITYARCNDEFIVSDGSNYLHFWDKETLTQKRKIEVFRQNGKPAKEINEIEYWKGRVIANIWYEDVIIVINPKTGVVEKEYDFSKLWDSKERKQTSKAGVLNGISVSSQLNVLYVTGKNWNRMYKIRLK